MSKPKHRGRHKTDPLPWSERIRDALSGFPFSPGKPARQASRRTGPKKHTGDSTKKVPWLSPARDYRLGRHLIYLSLISVAACRLFASARSSLLVYFVVLAGLIALALYGWKKQYKISPIAWIPLLYYFLAFLFPPDYTFVHQPHSIHLWPVWLVLSIFLAALAAVLLARRVFVLKDDRRSERIALVFLAGFFSFCLLASAYANLNFSLDRSPGQTQRVVILDKEARGSKSTTYYLTFRTGGQEVELRVYYADYKACAVGDTITVAVHAGFFHDPYYLLQATP